MSYLRSIYVLCLRGNWKRSTLRSVLTRTYKIFSTKELLDEEFKHIKREFIEINGYPK